jgi:hypothetical protein
MTEYKYDFVKIRVHDGIAWTALNREAQRHVARAPLRDG